MAYLIFSLRKLLVYLTIFLSCIASSNAFATIIVDISTTVTEGGNTNLTMSFSAPTPAYPRNELQFMWYLQNGSSNPFDSFSDFSYYAGNEKVTQGSVTHSIATNLIDDNTMEGTENGAICIAMSNINLADFSPNAFDFLTNSDYTASGDPCFNFSIIDDDTPTINFNTINSSGFESVAAATLQVDLSTQSSSSVSVDYSVTGNASNGVDFTLSNGTLTIPANSSSANIVIGSIIDDLTYEGNETVVVTLSDPSGAILGTDIAHTYTILENDPIPDLSIADIAVNEGASGASSQPNVIVSLSNPTTEIVSFVWSTQDGAATSMDSDYATDSQTVYIAAGDTSAILSPVIFGDDAFENDENFSIVLSGETNANISDWHWRYHNSK